MKIGILRETKSPPDRRVPLTPAQCRRLLQKYPGLEIVVQPSEMRCYKDEEYLAEGMAMNENLKGCDILMGVKEVEIAALIPGKTYLFFSHTAKEQPYNRKLLQAVLKRRIKLIDYEYLTLKDRSRVVAFGRWAGIVGAYNGLRAYGARAGRFELTPAWQLKGFIQMKEQLKNLDFGSPRIVITGGGRVAQGTVEVLHAAGIKEVTPANYISEKHSEAIFCRLDPWHYTRHNQNLDFSFDHFVEHPDAYENAFLPYAMVSDIYMACHFWDPRSPVILGKEELSNPELPLRVIADISCDIDGPIASTVRASEINNPFYGFDLKAMSETDDLFVDHVITVMAVDNLPGELPRDASKDFGSALIEKVMPSLLGKDTEGIIERATIAKDGFLTDSFEYLDKYSKGF